MERGNRNAIHARKREVREEQKNKEGEKVFDLDAEIRTVRQGSVYPIARIKTIANIDPSARNAAVVDDDGDIHFGMCVNACLHDGASEWMSERANGCVHTCVRERTNKMSPSADIPTIISATVPEGARRRESFGGERERGEGKRKIRPESGNYRIERRVSDVMEGGGL